MAGKAAAKAGKGKAGVRAAKARARRPRAGMAGPDPALLPKPDAALLGEGHRRIAWARSHMPVLAAIRGRFEDEQPFDGLRIGMALHVEAKTAVLALTLQAGGADVRLAGCNPQSTDDRAVLALNDLGLPTTAKKGQTRDEYYASLEWVLEHRPHFVIDDGGDLGMMSHTSHKECLEDLRGGCEETSTGVARFRAMARDGALRIPVLAVNDARMKHLFDNRYGTGQSTFDGILTATNLLIAGKRVVVAGYGWCGRGIAARAHGLGALVTVTEVDPVRALEARMDGFDVATMEQACATADLIVTATGCNRVVDRRHIPHLPDGCVLANAGHFNNEVDVEALAKAAVRTEEVRAGVQAYTMRDGRVVHLLTEGRLVNLAAGQGHPVEIMDLSFAVQALGMEHLVQNHGSLAPGVHEVPAEMDLEIARVKLATMGLRIDTLDAGQREYLASWEHGT